MENLNEKFDLTELDKIIEGRVEPKIYAFSTNTFPKYLKVGDTYRSVETRLSEWKSVYPDLCKEFDHSAKIKDENVFFRDYSVHKYLENCMKERLNAPNHSKEFFKDTTVEDIELAINDIEKSYREKKDKYTFYSNLALPVEFHYARNEEYEPRPNQKDAIEKFKTAINNNRKNLLMYAVMRFGKSFTTMCCAVEMKANFVVILSGKADVADEWKKTVESHKKFDGFVFKRSNDENLETILKNNRKIVLFLTLQELNGDDVKKRHQFLFGKNTKQIDLLVIDETHFAARAQHYGKVIQSEIGKSELIKQEKEAGETVETLNERSKVLNANVRLHLSGTPYRILMGSEFSKEDIISFCQFSDIASEKEKWDADNLNKVFADGKEVNEWDNPYFGFPQMIRFALKPNKSSLEKLNKLRKSGINFTLSRLFRPKSITEKSRDYNIFENEKEILELFKSIDGSIDDENVLGFLDYEKITNGEMCRHIVCVLPYRASCDALQKLISDHKNEFKNLGEYLILNISGLNPTLNCKDVRDIQTKIHEAEQSNWKTITLTVNKMMTGSTVKEWDTMLYFKDTSSPQEYDQAIFRLQNPYVNTYTDGNGGYVKYCMKPQTILVDFHPDRMFRLQEQKSQIYNVNIEDNGNDKLTERIERELEISPIVVLNSNKIEKITATNILEKVSEYSKERSVTDEATDIPADMQLLEIDELKSEILKQGELFSKNSFETRAIEHDGNGSDVYTGSSGINNNKSNLGNSDVSSESLEEDQTKSIEKKFATLYARILFFAFLTDTSVKSLVDVIDSINSNQDSIRIARNLGLDLNILELIRKNMNPFIRSKLDYKIQNINHLSVDYTLPPIDRALNALNKFSRFSTSEIVTPQNVAEMMCITLKENSGANIDKNSKILDIASKQGEFAVSIIETFNEQIDKNKIYSIATSTVAYEFTRKIYRILGVPESNVFENLTSYDIIKSSTELNSDLQKTIEIIKEMKFDAIVGNPPYHLGDGGARASAKPLYHLFVELAKVLGPKYITLIIPARWYSGGKGLDDFRAEMLEDKHIQELHDFLNPEELFSGLNIRGGVCYFLWNGGYDNGKDLVKVFTHKKDNPSVMVTRPLLDNCSDIFIRYGISIVKKVKSAEDFKSFSLFVSPRKPFGLGGDFTKNKKFRANNNGLKDPIICYGKNKKIGYLECSEITTNKEWIDIFKVYTPRANNIGTELNDDNFNAFLGYPKTICTESYLVLGSDLNLKKSSAKNLIEYFKTKFVRFLHGLAKSSQDATSKTYVFIPLQDFSKPWTDAELYAKYGLTQEEIDFIESMIKPME